MNNPWTHLKVALIAAVVVLAAGCGGGDGDSPAAAPAEAAAPPTGATNTPPSIQGQAINAVLAGQAYSFQPTASDANGDKLTFTAANVPSWASFNAQTGRLSGTPTPADVGNYAGIKISVSDGQASASFPTFSVAVTAVGSGSATLSWVPPTANTDGSVLTDLASYRILYGHSATDLDQSVDVDNPGMNRYVVENLTSGVWYFAVVAVNAGGDSSPQSNVASKTIS